MSEIMNLDGWDSSVHFSKWLLNPERTLPTAAVTSPTLPGSPPTRAPFLAGACLCCRKTAFVSVWPADLLPPNSYV